MVRDIPFSFTIRNELLGWMKTIINLNMKGIWIILCLAAHANVMIMESPSLKVSPKSQLISITFFCFTLNTYRKLSKFYFSMTNRCCCTNNMCTVKLSKTVMLSSKSKLCCVKLKSSQEVAHQRSQKCFLLGVSPLQAELKSKSITKKKYNGHLYNGWNQSNYVTERM